MQIQRTEDHDKGKPLDGWGTGYIGIVPTKDETNAKRRPLDEKGPPVVLTVLREYTPRCKTAVP